MAFIICYLLDVGPMEAVVGVGSMTGQALGGRHDHIKTPSLRQILCRERESLQEGVVGGVDVEVVAVEAVVVVASVELRTPPYRIVLIQWG